MHFHDRCRCPNNNLFLLALVFLVGFLLVELTIRIYDLYRNAPYVDIPSHFFAGVAICVGAAWVLSLNAIRRKRLAALAITLLAALSWEVLETLQELVVENPPYMQDIFFWDGIGDVLVTLAGGLFGLFIVLSLRQHTDWLDRVPI